jgi:parvulin-like peptidyl-prolyl isomerase
MWFHRNNLVVVGFCSLLLVLPAGAPLAGDFFGNEILVQGKDIVIRRDEVEKAYLQFKANATLRNQPIPDDRREELEATLLDRIVLTRLLMNRATQLDRQSGKAEADRFVTNVIKEAGSEAAFQRQLIALGFTRDDFETQVLERAVCEEVVERELRPQVRITDDQVKSYYQDHAEQLRRPEMVRASHILFSTRNADTGAELPDAQKAEKRRLADEVLRRARQGEDFAALALQYSDDPGSKEKGGEYLFARGRMVPEVEAAAFSLQTNQISDVVISQFGFHVVKLLQRIPAEIIPFDQVADDIRERLAQEEIQNTLLPAHLKRLKDAARLEYLHGARPPAVPSTGIQSSAAR